MMVFSVFYFFFSSRRRHTRYIGDWSSDVCSSDLAREQLYRGHAIDNAPLGCKPERPSQSRQMAVYRAALIAIIDHSGCELRDQFFVDVIQARLRQGCELQQTSVLAFIELDGLWVIGT